MSWRSLELLGARDSRILDVALASGFPNLKAYNSIFLKAFGVTPSKWRSQLPAGTQDSANQSRAYLPVDVNSSIQLLRPYLNGAD